MPESCWKCKYCTIFDVCSILSKRGKSDTYAIVPGEGRHKDCPLKQAENEQLQAQAARMREALRKAREAIKAAWSDGSANAAMDKASDALAAINKAIGGKEEGKEL